MTIKYPFFDGFLKEDLESLLKKSQVIRGYLLLEREREHNGVEEDDLQENPLLGNTKPPVIQPIKVRG